MHPLLLGILIANGSVLLFDIYIRIRQWNIVYQTTEEPEELGNDQSVARLFNRIRLNTLNRVEVTILFYIFKLIQISAVLTLYYPSWLWKFVSSRVRNQFWQPVAYVFGESIINDLSVFPLSLFVFLKIRHRFSEQKPLFIFVSIYFGKVILKSSSIAMVSYYTTILLENFGRNVFIWTWILTSLATILIIPIYIEVILPSLEDYTQISSGSLKEKLERMANEVNFPLTSIFISQGTHSNGDHMAYFTGMFNSKVIVISLNLISSMTEEEIVAIVAHEMGHWKLGHVWYYFGSRMLYQFFLCFFLRAFYENSDLFIAFKLIMEGVQPHPALSFILTADYMVPPFDRMLSIITNIITRLCEFEADQFAKEHGQDRHLKSALIKMYTNKLIFPLNDELYSISCLTHPSILERVRAL